jgi:hypothetical protein
MPYSNYDLSDVTRQTEPDWRVRRDGIVEGPRVGLTARFAEALVTSVSAELAAVSEDFEQMGELVAAVDAAAHAAIVCRGPDMRGSAVGCAARANASPTTATC